MRWIVVLFFTVMTLRLAAASEDPPCENLLQSSRQKQVQQLLEQISAYRDILQPFPDPFDHAFDLDESKRIFDGLSFTADPEHPGQRTRSILGETREFLNLKPATDFAQVEPILKKLLSYGEHQLQDPGGKGDLYRGLVAAEMLLPTLNLFVTLSSRTTADATGTSAQFTPRPLPHPEEETAPDGEAPNRYPEFSKHYQPHTKNTEAKRSKEKPTAVIEVNLPGVTHFRARVFNVVRRGLAKPFRSAPLPFVSTALRNYTTTRYHLKVNTMGLQTVTLLLPAGFVPLSPDPSKRLQVEADADGSYTLHLTDPSNRVELNLVDQDEQLNPAQIAFLTEPVGVSADEWPDEMKWNLLDHLHGLSAQAAAEKVEGYLRNPPHLYSVTAKPEKDPIDALKRGSFQCDMAAYLMVAILRDVLKIPSRAVEGLKGSSLGDGRSFAVVPGTGHAWVEAYIDGRWQTFDPTPWRKDKQSETEPEQSEYKTNEKPFDDKFNLSEDLGVDQGEGQGSQGAPGEGTAAEHQKKLELASKARLESLKDKDSTSAPPLDPTEEDDFESQAQRKALIDALKLGSLSLKSDEHFSPLQDRARHLYLRLSLNPRLDSYRSLQMIEALRTDEAAMNQQLMPIINAADRALARRQAPLVQALTALSDAVKTQDLTTTFQSLVQIQDRMNLYLQLLDPPEQAKLFEILKSITRLKKVFQGLNEQERVDRGMAEKFYENLPDITKTLIQERYKIPEIGNNLETKALLKDLSEGRLTDFNLIRILHPLTDFIMDAVPTPAYKTVSTYEEDTDYFLGPEFLPATHLANAFATTLRLQPLKSYAQNLLEGTLVKMVHRRRIDVPESGGKTNPQRFTIVNFDTSGSMAGLPGDFQSALISAFVDRAASDRHRHLVMLMGFDKTVHKIIKVRDRDEAKNLILNHRREMKNTEGDTDIMNALRENVAQIVAAQDSIGEPLASANIVLMSDGGSTVDVEELKQLFALVDRRTPLKFMFVAINGTNAQLVALTQRVMEAGASEAYYKEYTPELIKELVEESKHAPKPNLQRELYTRKTAADLPSDIDWQIAEVATQLNSEILRIEAVSHPRDLQGWSNEIEHIAYNPDHEKPTPIKLEIKRLRILINLSRALRDPTLVTTIVDDVLKRFPATFGKELPAVLLREKAEIEHLLREAKLYVSGAKVDR